MKMSTTWFNKEWRAKQIVGVMSIMVEDKPTATDASQYDKGISWTSGAWSWTSEFVTPDSPTQRVGGEVLDQFKKIWRTRINAQPAFKCFLKKEDLEEFDARLRREINRPCDWICVWIEKSWTLYRVDVSNGQLVLGATREVTNDWEDMLGMLHD